MKNRENDVPFCGKQNQHFWGKNRLYFGFGENSKKSFILLILTLYFRTLEHCICEREGGICLQSHSLDCSKIFVFSCPLSFS